MVNGIDDVDASFASDVTIEGNLLTIGDETIDGNLNVLGDTDLDSNLNVDNDTHIHGTLTVEGDGPETEVVIVSIPVVSLKSTVLTFAEIVTVL